MSSAAFPFARGVSAFVWNGVHEIDTSFVCFPLARRAIDASDHSFFPHWLDGPDGKHFDTVIAVGGNVVSRANHG